MSFLLLFFYSNSRLGVKLSYCYYYYSFVKKYNSLKGNVHTIGIDMYYNISNLYKKKII
ncbi:MAG: hypothetical protein LBV69_03420 [Bacteroidales bacterium]|jgi:hypothetical protein|nr:hypothetical protein [Bacteroidales bacterium]